MKRYLWGAALLALGIGTAFVLYKSEQVRWSAASSSLTTHFIYPDTSHVAEDTPIQRAYARATDQQPEDPSCVIAFEKITGARMRELFAKHCDRHSYCAALPLTHDLLACPVALSTLFRVLETPCEYFDESTISKRGKGRIDNMEDALFSVMRCGMQDEWTTISIRYLPGNSPVVLASYNPNPPKKE
ncbi:MAG TPA: hypothetical protein VHB79_24090 [Polyangiaceae bacterium]|nr:hypothetical protein [Polyangiaceae bacterium]